MRAIVSFDYVLKDDNSRALIALIEEFGFYPTDEYLARFACRFTKDKVAAIFVTGLLINIRNEVERLPVDCEVKCSD